MIIKDAFSNIYKLSASNMGYFARGNVIIKGRQRDIKCISDYFGITFYHFVKKAQAVGSTNSSQAW